MKLHSTQAVYSQVLDLYGITPNEDSFDNIILTGLSLIGNRSTEIKKLIGATDDKHLELPCEVLFVDSITTMPLGAKTVTPGHTIPYEVHTDGSALYPKGDLVEYRTHGNLLEFNKDYSALCITYHEERVDEEGMPLITDRELVALAAYVAYVELYKRGIAMKDGNQLQLAATVKADWLRACNHARTPEYVSQNEMDQILDAHTRWDRKHYGQAMKKTNR